MSITIMRSTLDFLSFCYIWPKKNEELDASNRYYVNFFLVLFSTLVNLIGSILHLALVSIPNASFYHIAEDLITVTAQTAVYYYITTFVLFQRIASRLYLKLSSFDTFGKPPDFDQHSMKLQFLATVFKICVNIVIVAYFFEPMLTRKSCEKENETARFKDNCGLIAPAWMPFDIEAFPARQFFYFWQTYSVCWVYYNSVAISLLILSSVEYILVRIWHLKKMIKEAVETGDEELRKKRISKCLGYHIYIFGISADADEAYQMTLFGHVLFTGLLFGIMGFSILSVGISAKTISLFVAWMNSVIFASFSAQRLYDASISVAEEVYNSKWYCTDYRFQRNLILIMQRAQKPITIHGGPFTTISNIFILGIFKTAYSYLTLLTATSK